MLAWLTTTLWLAAAGLPVAAPPAAHTLPPRPQKTHGFKVAPAATFNVNVSPGTISFNAINPDSSPVDAGSSAASVTWQNLDFNEGAWTLTVQATSSSFTNCSTVPISAVTVSCASVSTSIGGSGSCSAPFTLTTSPQVVAGGNQSFITYSYSVAVNFTLNDSWKYIAETSPSCSLSLSYVATVP